MRKREITEEEFKELIRFCNPEEVWEVRHINNLSVPFNVEDHYTCEIKKINEDFEKRRGKSLHEIGYFSNLIQRSPYLGYNEFRLYWKSGRNKGKEVKSNNRSYIKYKGMNLYYPLVKSTLCVGLNVDLFEMVEEEDVPIERKEEYLRLFPERRYSIYKFLPLYYFKDKDLVLPKSFFTESFVPYKKHKLKKTKPFRFVLDKSVRYLKR